MKKKNWTLSTSRVITYAMASLGGGMTDFPISIFLIPFYTEVIGINPAFAGLVTIIAGLYDAFTDPFSGIITDKTRTRFGRRRPYFLIGALPLGLTFWWLFHPISGWEQGSFLVSYLAFVTCMDIVFVPHFALSAELSQDYNERTRVTAYNRGLWILGLFFGVLIPIFIQEMIKDARSSYNAMGISLGVIMVITSLISFFGTKEKPEFYQNSSNIGLKEQFMIILKNKHFRFLLFSYLLYNAAAAIPNTVLIYYATNWLEIPQSDILIAVPIMLVGAIISVPLWLKYSKKTSKKAGAIAAFIFSAISVAALYFVPRGVILPIYFIFVVSGIGYAGLMIMPSAMLSDVIDFDEFKSGQRREGIYFGIWELSRKIGQYVAIGLTMQLLAVAGFVQQMDQTPAVDEVIRKTISLLPTVIYLLGALVMAFFKFNRSELSDIQDRIREQKIQKSIQL